MSGPEEKREVAILRLVGQDIQASEPMPNGNIVIRVHAIIPGEVLKSTRILLLNGGIQNNILEGVLAAHPTVEVQVYSDKLNPSFLKMNKEQGGIHGEKE